MPMVRIQLRYPDEATFIQRFAPNVTRGGIFLASRSPHPTGTVITFEVAIMQGPPLLAGTGKVTWVRDFNPNEPQRAHGMGVQFLQIAPNTKPMLDKLIEQKAQPPRLTPVAGVPVTSPRPDARRPTPAETPIALDGDPSTWIDDQAVKQAIDRARLLASRIEDVEALRVRDKEEPPTLKQALADLPRLLGPRRQQIS
jgi:uncharacterized protein (TIGR02266 family)